MDFEAVIKTLNKHLTEERPQKFNSSWVRRTAPRIYRFIQNKIGTETGGIDWDLITRALNPEFQSNGPHLIVREQNRIGVRARLVQTL